jgi:hypothetical protein
MKNETDILTTVRGHFEYVTRLFRLQKYLSPGLKLLVRLLSVITSEPEIRMATKCGAVAELLLF